MASALEVEVVFFDLKELIVFNHDALADKPSPEIATWAMIAGAQGAGS